jgi:hypothetical protein
MRKSPSSFTVIGRASISGLFFASSLALAVLALNPTLINTRVAPLAKTKRLILLGPQQSSQVSQETAGVAAPASPTPATPAAPPSGEYIGFENFEAPGTLVNVTSSSQGPSPNTVEYLAHDAGEPSIGVNWQSVQDPTKGITAFQSDLETAFIKFDDSCPASGVKASWYMSQAPTSQFVDSDPIAFTDHTTGRTFCGQLTLTTPTCKISFTDTDGLDALNMPDAAGWTASVSTLGSGIDHETIGGGPYHSPIPTLPTPYNHAVYFASQDLVAAFTLRSDDGGATWGPPVDMYTTECGGLHGHVKVEESTAATNGTVYLPNNDCGGQGAVIVSADNGLTWTIRPVPNTVSGQSDPAVAIDRAGRAYFIISSSAGNGSQAIVATSTDQGQTWQNTFDVGAAFGLANITYPAAIAGDAGRAAIAFYGSTTGGNQSQDGANGFAGVWHLYVAETFDGGATWTTVDATPNAPMQRGCIWTGGGVDICRNLLDFFDMTVDKQGRVEVGYVNGCAGGNCAQSAPTAFGNAYTATGTIARQSSGKRLFAANDPPSTTSAPGMPFVTQRRIGGTVHLAWSEADTGNLPITSYLILRGLISGGEVPIATVTGTQTGGTYTDLTATDTTATYYYKVQAINAVGTSCGNNEIAAPYIGNGCTGLIVQKTPPGHPEQPGGAGAAPASLAIDYIAVGEPANSPGNFMFVMKVTGPLTAPLPPNSRWRIVWDSFKSSGQQFYVGMQTDSSSAVTFGYGTVMTGAIPPVVGLIGVPIETPVASALAASNFQTDGTITIFVPKSAVGNPQPGDLLGAVNGRTFTGDTSQTVTLERSTLLVDHTFVKAQRDNGSPAATYTVLGNSACEGGIVPMSAVSRKTHGTAGTFNINLPLSGSVGEETRSGGIPSGNHTIVVTFFTPISAVASATCAGNAATTSISGNTVTVNCTGVPNAQTIAINLLGVNDGINVGDVSIPMAVLLGDVNLTRSVDGNDVSAVQGHTRQTVDSSNFRFDVNATGGIDGNDVSLTQSATRTSLH